MNPNTPHIKVEDLKKIRPESLHYYTESGRYYKINRNYLVGVGTVLSSAEPQETVKFYTDYRAKNPGKLEQARARGVDFHKAIACYLCGEKAAISDSFAKLWSVGLSFIKNISDPLLVEAPVWNEPLGYAGTLDAVAVINDRLTLFDWKTSTRPKWKPSWKYPLQLTAYSLALRYVTGINVERGATAVFSKECVQVYYYDLRVYADEWKSIVSNYLGTQKNILPVENAKIDKAAQCLESANP